MANTGFTIAGTGADGGGGTKAWTNPNNITISGTSQWAVGGTTLEGGSNFIHATNFGFSIPVGNKITSVVAQIYGRDQTLEAYDSSNNYNWVDGSCNLIVGGSRSTALARSSGPAQWTRDTTIDKRFSVADLNLTPAQVNASNFGIAYSISGISFGEFKVEFRLYYIRVDVTYESTSNAYVKDAGVWKKTGLSYFRDAGVWKPAISYVKDAGVWKI